jgi:hypothetical protein
MTKTRKECPVVAIMLSAGALEQLEEDGLLEMAFAAYKGKHPLEKPDVAFASAIGCDPKTIRNAIGGQSRLGTTSWLKIERLIGIPLYSQWFNVQREKINE